MTKKTKIFLGLAAAVLATGGITVVVAYDQVCVDPEAQFLRMFQARGGDATPEGREKLKGLPIFEKLEAQWCARQHMPQAEIDRIAEEKRQMALKHQQEIEEWRKAGMLEPRRLSPAELGIQPDTIDFVPPPGAYIQPTNTWLGYMGDTLLSITGTAKRDNPRQGAIFIMENDHVEGSKVYLTPTATGPVKVVSEKNGVLTLQSIAGTYEIAGNGKVMTPGGVTYSFDVKTRTFK
jgi:hypothetical protein